MWYKNTRAQNILIFSFSFIGIASSVWVFTQKPAITQEERVLIETEVFSVLVDYITLHPEINVDHIFLGISGSDPAPEILEYFSGNKPAVESISSSEVTYGFFAHVVHKEDLNKRGIQINLDIFDKAPSGYVKVQASMYKNRGSSAYYEYTLARSDGKYTILSVKRPESVGFLD